MKSYEIAKELNVDPSTISRDIQYLTAQSQNYLNDLARETLPFMYEMSMEGIRSVMKECWNIYYNQSKGDKTNNNINWYQKLAALKLAKECNEAGFRLLSEGPSVMYVKILEERLNKIENRQIDQ